MNLDGFSFQPPAGFRTEEQTIAMRLPFANQGLGPSPSLIVQTRLTRPGATVKDLAAQTFTELASNVPKMKQASQAEFAFNDGGLGMVLAYSFPTQTGELRQYFVLRLQGDRLCTITLTVPTSALTESSAKSYLNAIASVVPA